MSRFDERDSVNHPREHEPEFNRLIEAGLSRRGFLKGVGAASMVAFFAASPVARAVAATTQPLLGPDGILQEPGWSRRPLQLYSRADIKKRPTRIKEWDYYSVLSPSGDFGVCFTLSDDGYIGLQSVTFLDFKNAFEHTETILNAFPMGKLHMPSFLSQ
jgi:hypothetical protein